MKCSICHAPIPEGSYTEAKMGRMWKPICDHCAIECPLPMTLKYKPPLPEGLKKAFKTIDAIFYSFLIVLSLTTIAALISKVTSGH